MEPENGVAGRAGEVAMPGPDVPGPAQEVLAAFRPGVFAGRKALVTGASRGIGRTVAVTLAALGADVAVGFVRNGEMAEETCRGVRALGRRAVAVQADLERVDAIDGMFEHVQAELGDADIFVANAAATAFKPSLELRAYHIDRTLALNLRGFALSANRAAERMSENGGGHIVAISGYGSVRCLPGYAALGSAKAAVETWVRYLACEWAPLGVHVNAINPGCLETDSASVYFERSGAAPQGHVFALTPMQRPTRPADVAGMVAFLCSPAADFVCGQTLVVDGGLTLAGPPYPAAWMERAAGTLNRSMPLGADAP